MRTAAHIIETVGKLVKNMILEIPMSFVNAWKLKFIL